MDASFQSIVSIGIPAAQLFTLVGYAIHIGISLKEKPSFEEVEKMIKDQTQQQFGRLDERIHDQRDIMDEKIKAQYTILTDRMEFIKERIEAIAKKLDVNIPAK
jgi:guanylate kinase